MTIINLDRSSTKEEIDEFEKQSSKGKWLIKYHANWCGHCKSMIPEWKKFEQNNINFNIASIDVDVFPKLTNKPFISGFPTIKLFNNGKSVKEFNDYRTSDNFQKFYMKGGFKKKTKTKTKSIKNKSKLYIKLKSVKGMKK